MRFVCAAMCLVMAMANYCANAATYYISSIGNDTTHQGLSETDAWGSIAKVNSTTFAPGDSILFEGGHVFSGSIFFGPSVKGSSTQPVYIGSYGSGRATISSGTDAGIYVENTAGFKIQNLVFEGSGRETNKRVGIDFYMELPNTKLSYVAIDNVEVYGYLNAGISVGSWNGTSGYDNVSITNCAVHDNGDNGISTYAYDYKIGHTNVYVGYCKVYNNPGIPTKTYSHSGNGILLGGVNGATIEYCEAYNNGYLNAWASGGPVGIWGYMCNNLVIQYNESHHNKTGTTKDGGGFDIDGGSTNAIMQYNYSHDNEGAGYLLAQFSGAPTMKGLIVRYNISENDGRRNSYGAIHLWSSGSNGGIQDAQIYNNTIYLTPAASGSPKAVWVQSGGKTVATFRNNVFVTTGGLKLLQAQITPDLRFEGNAYWSTGATPSFTWNSTTYTSLEAWRTATGQEMRNGSALGYFVDPDLTDPGKGVTVSSPSRLYTLKGYELKKTSALIGKGLDLATTYSLNPGIRDFWGNSIVQRADLCIGAHQLTETSKVCLCEERQPLTFGVIAGGTYAGSGVTEATYFTPKLAGAGYHALTYTYLDGQGMSQTLHRTMAVTDATTTSWTGAAGSQDWFDSQNWTSCVPSSLVDANIPAAEEGVAIFPKVKGGEHATTHALSAVGLLTLEPNSTLEINDALLAHNFEADPLATVSFNSSTAQVVPAGTYGSLTLQGIGTKTLAGAVKVTKSLALDQGMLKLGENNLTIDTGGTITNYGFDSYIATDGKGSLTYNFNQPGITRVYPIGTTKNYTPVTFRNDGTPDNFSIRVEEGFKTDATNGTNAEQGVVNKTWHIAEETVGGSNATITLQWNASDELTNFSREEGYISHYENDQWNQMQNSVGTINSGSAADSYVMSLTGVTSFSPFAVASQQPSYAPLPVQLLYFKAKQDGNSGLLEWETASEQNNTGFEVEASADGLKFQKIGFVQSKSINSNNRLQYSFRDTDYHDNETRYYRLRQVDFDGKAVFSAIEAVVYKAVVLAVAAYPNPFADLLYLQVTSPQAQELQVTLTDMQGKKVFMNSIQVKAGENKLPINMNGISESKTYILSVYLNNKVVHIKLLKA